jgi:hypothetical protein
MQLFRRTSFGGATAGSGGDGAAGVVGTASTASTPRGGQRESLLAPTNARREREERPPLPRFPEVRMPATSLLEAAYLGDLDGMKTFLEEGANPDTSQGGVTPLHLATQQVRRHCVLVFSCGGVRALAVLIVCCGRFPDCC